MIERMIAIRIDADETQAELAQALGYHRVQIAKYENGTNTPGINYVIEFCKHYNVSADYILGLKQDLSWPRNPKGGRRDQSSGRAQNGSL